MLYGETVVEYHSVSNIAALQQHSREANNRADDESRDRCSGHPAPFPSGAELAEIQKRKEGLKSGPIICNAVEYDKTIAPRQKEPGAGIGRGSKLGP